MIRKVTKDNDGNAYEATASTEYFINNLVVDENSLVWLETIVGQGRGRDRERGQGQESHGHREQVRRGGGEVERTSESIQN